MIKLDQYTTAEMAFLYTQSWLETKTALQRFCFRNAKPHVIFERQLSLPQTLLVSLVELAYVFVINTTLEHCNQIHIQTGREHHDETSWNIKLSSWIVFATNPPLLHRHKEICMFIIRLEERSNHWKKTHLSKEGRQALIFSSSTKQRLYRSILNSNKHVGIAKESKMLSKMTEDRDKPLLSLNIYTNR